VIWALEAAERFGRLSCSECSDEQKRRYGCGREKAGVVGETVFRSTSLLLADHGKPAELRECPVGRVLREAPYVYKAISHATHVANGATDPANAPSWLQGLTQVVLSERARLRELNQDKDRGASDAEQARRVMRG
jgi:hypothetical protein